MNKEKMMLVADIRLGYLIGFMWTIFSPYKAHMMGELDMWVISVIGGVGMLLVEAVEWINKKTDLSSSFLLMVTYDAIFICVVGFSRILLNDYWFVFVTAISVMPYWLIVSNFRTKMTAWMGGRYKKSVVERLNSRIHRLENRWTMLAVLITTVVSGITSNDTVLWIFIVLGILESIYGLYAYRKYFRTIK